MAYSDFVLTKIIKQKNYKTNEESRKSFNFVPVNRINVIGFSTILWVPVFYISTVLDIYLEYKIIVIVTCLLIISSLSYLYIFKKTSQKIAKESLPLIILFSLPGGIIIMSLLAVFQKYFGFSWWKALTDQGLRQEWRPDRSALLKREDVTISSVVTILNWILSPLLCLVFMINCILLM